MSPVGKHVQRSSRLNEGNLDRRKQVQDAPDQVEATVSGVEVKDSLPWFTTDLSLVDDVHV